jgi:hypothetical protein
MNAGVDAIADDLHRAVAHYKEAAAGVLAAEVCFAPFLTTTPIGRFRFIVILIP